VCGFAGFLGPNIKAHGADPAELVRRMCDTLAHRGPDDAGVWVDDVVALGHRRLAVLDLSAAGHQPMVSADERYVIVFNGEIYNHLELRGELRHGPPQRDATRARGAADPPASPAWRGRSDTETLLAAVATWGVANALRRCVGMYAFALWDRQGRQLTLARDRLGEKPLYYGWQGDAFLFGSELKALRVHPRFSTEIDRNALALLLRHNYVPAPYTIYQGIHKLTPGACLTVSADGQKAVPVPYWSAREVAEQGQRNRFRGSRDDARVELDLLLRQAVKGQMLADVPLGAFLSGGVDSSAVVALMQAQSSRPTRTFTIGFWEQGYNEADFAKAVALQLKTDHTELYVTEANALAVVPQLPGIYDEPFADSSQIPTFLVSQLARRHVTVSLSGDGGDELFGGYNRYFWATAIWRRMRWLPSPMRAALAAALTRVPPQHWNGLVQPLMRLLPPSWRYANPGDKLHKLAEILAVRQPDEIYHALVSHWPRPASIVVRGEEPDTALTNKLAWAHIDEFAHRMMYLDLVSYLPDDILVKVDRAAMNVSLETRVPFLDHRLVEFAWRLPLSMKIRNGRGKWLLRQLLRSYIPERLIERPKMGFGVPLDAWLRGPLRSWAEALLDEARLRREGYFQPEPIRRLFAEHLSGRRNWAYHLWDVLMFQAWHEQVVR
jgi:asparagine synthase (glutamine-hydrolysing)